MSSIADLKEQSVVNNEEIEAAELISDLKPQHWNTCKMEDNKKIIRKDSFQKLMNNYICDPNLLIIPNVLTWLKTSILQSNVEKIIASVKGVFYTCISYFTLIRRIELLTVKIKYRLTEYKSVKNDIKCVVQKSSNDTSTSSANTSSENDEESDEKTRIKKERYYRAPSPIPKKQNLVLNIAVYFAIFIIHLQLVLICIAFISNHFPIGLIFLLITLVMIVTIAFSTMEIFEKDAQKHQRNKVQSNLVITRGINIAVKSA